MRTRVSLTRSVFYLLAFTPTIALAQELSSQRPMPDAVLESGTLSFLGHATVGDFVGVTTSVTGAIVGGRDYTVARGWVEAPVRTLLTGNDHRDSDLRGSMEVRRFPMMRFDLSGATFATSSVARLDSTVMMLHGALSIHGVTRNVDLPATVRRSADKTYITARFPLSLADYEIGGLTKMFGLLRMQNQIEVRVELVFVDTPTLWANP